MKKLSYAAAVLAMFAIGGCGDVAQIAAPAGVEPLFNSANASRGGGGVLYAHRAPGTQPFKDEVVTFTVKPGEAATAELTFADGTPFATFHVGETSLQGATLNGVAIDPTKPVEISIRRVDASRYVLDMQPSGLVFNSEAPARVEFFYENARLPRGTVQVYKQESFGETWTDVETIDDTALQVMAGDVEDFTIYAMAAPH